MKFERKKIAVALAYALGAGSTLLIAAPSQAADISVSVTGSNIPRTEIEGNAPIQVLTSEDLVRSGYTTVSEVLRDITSNGNGLLGQGFAGAFAGGASGVALRGLTVGATLTLIDGMRMVPYPVGDDGQRNFVDISSIPFSAIDRIEVLLDGASAIYGSDAIGGVVNVILKKSFQGTQFNVDGGVTSKGDGGNVHVSFAQGFGESGGPMFGIVTAEYRHQSAISYNSRSGKDWANQNWRPFGGNDIRPGAYEPNVTTNTIVQTPYLQRPGGNTSLPENNAFLDSRCSLVLRNANQCVYDNTWSQIQPETQNINVMGSFTAKLGDGWQANMTGSWFDSQAESQRRPQVVPAASFAPNIAIGPGQDPSLVNGLPVFTVPASYPGNPFGVPANVRALVPDIENQNSQFDTKTLRLVGQLTGTGWGWDTILSAGYMKAKAEVKRNGYVNETLLLAALNDPVNPFLLTGGNPASVVSLIAPTVTDTKTNELDFVQLTGSRELMKLQGGPLGFALGGTWVYNDLKAGNPAQCKDGSVAGLNCAYAIGDQTTTAVFAELNAPVLKSLELSAAARYDHYDTYGGQVTPKFGAKWTPLKEAAFRGTWGKGFRAPSVSETSDAKLVFGALAFRDRGNCPASLPSGAPDLTSPLNVITPNQCALNPPFLENTNPDLKAEKSTNWTVGGIFEPIPGWSTSVDYYQIKLSNQILPASTFADFNPANFVVRGPINSVTFGDGRQGPSPVGVLNYIGDTYINSTTTKTSGLDLMSNYTMTLPDTSRLKFVAQWSHIFKYDFSYQGQTNDLAGTHGPAIISGNTGNPKDRLQLTGQWAKGPFTGTLMGNYTSGYNNTDLAAGFDCLGMTQYANAQRYNGDEVVPDNYCKIKSFWYWNLNLQYQYDKQTMVQFSVINLFNQQAPVDLGSYSGAGDNRNTGRGAPYNSLLHNPGIVGTSFQLGLTYNF